LIDDDKPASYYIGKLKKEADRINDLSIPHNPLTTNSNAAASEMLKGAGIPLPPPEKMPRWIPGWGRKLPAQ